MTRALPAGSTSAMTSSRPSVRADRLGGGAAVAGEHDHAEPFGVKQANGLGSGRLDGIGHAQEAGESAVDGQVHHGLPVAAQFLGTRGERRRVGRLGAQQAQVAERHAPALGEPGHALPGHRLEALDARGRHPALGGAREHGGGERVLAPLLEPGGEREHLVFREAGGRHHRDEARLALGERAGLVDDDGVDLLHDLERLGALDQDACLGAAAGGHHDGDRRGEAERTGTGDDQHGDGVHQGIGQARLGAPEAPRERRHHRHRHHRRHEPRGDDVGEALDGRAACAAPRRPSGRSGPGAYRRRRAPRASRSRPCRSRCRP